jgi:hypothetical protein
MEQIKKFKYKRPDTPLADTPLADNTNQKSILGGSTKSTSGLTSRNINGKPSLNPNPASKNNKITEDSKLKSKADAIEGKFKGINPVKEMMNKNADKFNGASKLKEVVIKKKSPSVSVAKDTVYSPSSKFKGLAEGTILNQRGKEMGTTGLKSLSNSQKKEMGPGTSYAKGNDSTFKKQEVKNDSIQKSRKESGYYKIPKLLRK